MGIYLCGLTVQGPPHIGHLRSGVSYDVLINWLRHLGYDVTYVRNITDIDDKILTRETEQGRHWWAIAYENERALNRDYAALGVRAPTYEPRATGHMTEMISLISELLEKGHAYVTWNGDVYFSVASWNEYGALSHRRPEDVQSSPDTGDKQDPRDFALWKGYKEGEPADACWNSPWGYGRPGWHIECSAMSRRYLGDGFDIHGGGVDIMFPHHENEMAQSHAAGLPFTAFWVHNGMLNLSGSKMSKSVGNTLSVTALAEKGFRPVDIRYYLVSAHYRSPLEYHDESLKEAAAAYDRIANYVRRAAEALGEDKTDPEQATTPILCADFVNAMDDDLNTPMALAAVHDQIREGNAALDAKNLEAAESVAVGVRFMLKLLGLDPLDPHWNEPADAKGSGALDALVSIALQQRSDARKRKDFAAADAIRDQLSEAGILVKDTPQGPTWTTQ